MKVTSNKKGDTLIIISFLNKQTNKQEYPCQKALTPIYIYFAASQLNVVHVESSSDSVITSHQSHDSKQATMQQVVSKDLKKKHNEIQEKHETAIKKLSNLQEKYNNLQKKHKTTLDELMQSKDKLNTVIKEHKQSEISMQALMNTVLESSQEKQSELQEEHRATLSELQKKHKSTLSKIQKKHNTTLHELAQAKEQLKKVSNQNELLEQSTMEQQSTWYPSKKRENARVLKSKIDEIMKEVNTKQEMIHVEENKCKTLIERIENLKADSNSDQLKEQQTKKLQILLTGIEKMHIQLIEPNTSFNEYCKEYNQIVSHSERIVDQALVLQKDIPKYRNYIKYLSEFQENSSHIQMVQNDFVAVKQQCTKLYSAAVDKTKELRIVKKKLRKLRHEMEDLEEEGDLSEVAANKMNARIEKIVVSAAALSRDVEVKQSRIMKLSEKYPVRLSLLKYESLSINKSGVRRNDRDFVQWLQKQGVFVNRSKKQDYDNENEWVIQQNLIRTKLLGDSSNRYITLKRIRKNKSSEQSIRNEIKILRKLSSCPYVINIEAVFVDSEDIYIQMPYCKYGDLLHWAKELAPEETESTTDKKNGLREYATKKTALEIKCVLRQVVQGIAILHEHSISHNDIKLEVCCLLLFVCCL